MENKNSREATFKKVTERLRSCYDKKMLAIASQRWKGRRASKIGDGGVAGMKAGRTVMG